MCFFQSLINQNSKLYSFHRVIGSKGRIKKKKKKISVLVQPNFSLIFRTWGGCDAVASAAGNWWKWRPTTVVSCVRTGNIDPGEGERSQAKYTPGSAASGVGWRAPASSACTPAPWSSAAPSAAAGCSPPRPSEWFPYSSACLWGGFRRQGSTVRVSWPADRNSAGILFFFF